MTFGMAHSCPAVAAAQAPQRRAREDVIVVIRAPQAGPNR